MDDEKDELNRILCNAIKDIMTHGCGSLPYQMPESNEEKMCQIVSKC